MRPFSALTTLRDREWEYRGRSAGTEQHACYAVPCEETGVILSCIASRGGGWDHVSVSLPMRCPTWAEMEHVKRTFFADDEAAMQLHVPPAEHVNLHPFCLHLWRPQRRRLPRPPAEMVW